MKREAFLRELKAIATKRGLPFEIDKKIGKGSHYAVRLGGKGTIVKSGELNPLYIKIIKKQLGL